ncbi:MAG TPA: hypothetical protein VEH04_11240 [Verrucomicrobiae bacterium]|nr:hypothetical protein [Verrucomicrobiae bacterium]
MKVYPHKSHGKPCFRGVCNVAGRRIYKIFHSLEAAEAWLSKQKARIETEGAIIASLPNHERMLLGAFLCRLHAEGLTIEKAMERVFRKSAQFEAPSLSEGVELFLSDLAERRMASRYISQIRSVLQQFTLQFPEKKVHEVSVDDVRSWRDAPGYSTSSRRSRLTDVKTFFRFAKNAKWRADNPSEGLKSPKIIRSMPGVLDVEDARRLLLAASQHDPGLCAPLALGLFCGIRPAEIGRLNSNHVMIEEGITEIPYDVAKGNLKRRIVNIPENAREWLSIPTSLPVKNWAKRFTSVRKLSDLLVGWPHDAMRHSAATYLLALKCDAAHVADQLGHTVQVLQTHYRATRTRTGKIVSQNLAREYFEIRPTLTA